MQRDSAANTVAYRSLWFVIAVATVTVLGGILGVPVLSGLFLFTAPSPAMLLAGLGAAVLSLLWFEAVTWGLGRYAAPAA